MVRRRPRELDRIAHGSYKVAGHRNACPGTTELHIRLIDGMYRVALSCSCLVVCDLAAGEYKTFIEADAAAKSAVRCLIR